jgi:5-hydroxyisourate hydrolase
MTPITVHVLDTTVGRPAAHLGVRLDLLDDAGGWTTLAESHTNAEGRVVDLALPSPLARRTYRVTFATGPYFAAVGRPVFYPWVDVVFSVDAPDEHHHIPLLLSPFGYSTYRGS